MEERGRKLKKAGVAVATVAAALIGLVGVPSAHAADIPDFQASLTVSPGSVSWPDSTRFERRLSVTAGPGGADLEVSFRDPAQKLGGVDFHPFAAGSARLEGPGVLTGRPMPMVLRMDACGRPIPTAPRYNLKLEPDQQTTVVARSTLRTPAMPGMKHSVHAQVWPSLDGPVSSLTAPLAIGGPRDVLIRARIARKGDSALVRMRKGRSFRLTGKTTPALPNRTLKVLAQPRLNSGKATPRKLSVVTTDAHGRFRSGPIRPETGVWAVTVKLARAGKFAGTAQCVGSISVLPARKRVTTAKLLGRSYVSTSISDRVRTPKKIKLRFFRHAIRPDGSNRKVPTLAASAGCNAMGAKYVVRNGRLRWIGGVMSTDMFCRPNYDPRLTRLLKRGMKAKLKGKKLILTSGNARFALRRTR